MSLLNWLRPRSKNAPKPAATRPRARLGLEAMEDRTVPSWLAQIGGAGDDTVDIQRYGRPVADAAGNMYVVGTAAAGADLDPGPAVATHPGGNFVAKYTPFDTAGNGLPDGGLRFAWTHALPTGSDNNTQMAVAADVGTGAVYVAGMFTGSYNFGNGQTLTSSPPPTKSGTPKLDVYVVRLAEATGSTVWARQVGGSGTEWVSDVATDGTSVYVAGTFAAASKETNDFDPGPGTKLLTSKGGQDGYMLKLTQGGAFTAVWQIGGAGPFEYVSRILLDGPTAYVGGYIDGYTGGNLNGTIDLDSRWTYPGNIDVLARAASGNADFIASFDVSRSPETGRTLNWAMSTPDDAFNYGPVMAVDATHLYVASSVDAVSPHDLDPGPATVNPVSAGGNDVVVAKYVKATGALVRATDGTPWVRQFGQAGSETVYSIRVTPDGGIFLAGTFSSTVDFGGGVFSKVAGSTDGYILQLNADGTYWQAWAQDALTYLLGVYDGRMYVAGGIPREATFLSGDTLTPSGVSDIFLMALDVPQSLPPS